MGRDVALEEKIEKNDTPIDAISYKCSKVTEALPVAGVRAYSMGLCGRPREI
jgi:hypothetical protein